MLVCECVLLKDYVYVSQCNQFVDFILYTKTPHLIQLVANGAKNIYIYYLHQKLCSIYEKINENNYEFKYRFMVVPKSEREKERVREEERERKKERKCSPQSHLFQLDEMSKMRNLLEENLRPKTTCKQMIFFVFVVFIKLLWWWRWAWVWAWAPAQEWVQKRARALIHTYNIIFLREKKTMAQKCEKKVLKIKTTNAEKENKKQTPSTHGNLIISHNNAILFWFYWCVCVDGDRLHRSALVIKCKKYRFPVFLSHFCHWFDVSSTWFG